MTARAAADAGIDQATAHLNALAFGEEQRAPSLPLPFDDYDIPAALSLPILEPRATKQRRQEIAETSSTLLNFVSHMTLDDLRSSLASPSFSRAHVTETPIKDSENPSSVKSGRDEAFQEGVATLHALGPSQPPTSTCTSTTQWSLTTPETVKATISTPQARRLGSQKRKSPMQQIHCTPVDGNRPLLIPTLNTVTSRMPMMTSRTPQNNSHRPERKKAKSHMTLLHSAPMLPASPDLENRSRQRAMISTVPCRQGFPALCFSPSNGVTLVHPSMLRRAVAAASTPTPTGPRRTVVSLVGLPSLEEVERTEHKWLRMKRRDSLLCALRLAATESS